MDKKNILYLCTGNSCRSQMAEGWTKALKGDRYNVYSAGITAHGLNPKAVQVMSEAGVDISNQQSQIMDEFLDLDIDIVVTVCASAHDTCPVFPQKAEIKHVGFDDPPALEKAETDEEAKLDHYRRVRDEIKAFVETL